MSSNKNPSDNDGVVSLHHAAQKGHCEIWESPFSVLNSKQKADILQFFFMTFWEDAFYQMWEREFWRIENKTLANQQRVFNMHYLQQGVWGDLGHLKSH